MSKRLLAIVAVLAGIAVGSGIAVLSRSHASRASPNSAATIRERLHTSTGGRTTPPNFTGAEGDGRIPEARPDAPDYNPAAFVAVKSLRSIFANEPRVEKWARPVETYLSSKIGTELPKLIPGIQLKAVECKTATCSVKFEQGPAISEVNPHKIQQMLALLYSSAAGAYSRSDLEFFLVYRGTSWFRNVPGDDPQALMAAIEKRRAHALERVRTKHAAGKPIPFKLLDPSTLPPK